MDTSDTRREFIKRAAYIAPAILTLAAAPAYAKAGSDKSPQAPDHEYGNQWRDPGDGDHGYGRRGPGDGD